MKQFVVAVVVALTLMIPGLAAAEGVKVYVEPFSVAGGGDASLAGALQNLFANRLSGKEIQVQQAPAGAQLLVKGSLTQLGKSFSIDVAAVEPGGAVAARCYEQGEGQDAILPALNKLAEKLSGQLASTFAARRAAPQPEPPAVAAPAPVPAPATAAPPAPVEPGAIVRSEKAPSKPHKRIEGALVAMAPAKTLPDGDREVFLASDGSLFYYRVGSKVDKLAETKLPSGEKIIALDSADLDGDGTAEVYVTVVQSGEPVSQVWTMRNGRLTRLADNLPYFFRTLSGPGLSGKVFAQQVGRTEDFYGPVYEVRRTGSKIEVQNALTLPDNGNIYNFTRFTDSTGTYTVLLNAGGTLVVYGSDGKEAWRSNDQYGGTETYIGRDDQQNQPITGSAVRKIFLQPRMEVTRDGEIVVARNTGTFVVGTHRSYSKHTLYAFSWNGASLEERWHTTPVETYLPDFRFDGNRDELLLLEVVKKEGLVAKGASTVTVRKLK